MSIWGNCTRMVVIGIVMVLLCGSTGVFVEAAKGESERFEIDTFTRITNDEMIKTEGVINNIPSQSTLLDISTSPSTSKFDKIATSSIPILRYRPLELNPIFGYSYGLKAGSPIILNLFEDKNYTAQIDKISTNVLGTMTLQGHLDVFPTSLFLMSITDGQMLGNIEVPERKEKYLIKYDMDYNSHCIFDLDTNKINRLPCESAVYPLTSDNDNLKTAKTTKPKVENPLAQASIDVMIVYTQAARQWANSNGGINNVISDAMTRAQLSLDNSDTFVTMSLVHSQEVTYTESGNMLTDLNRLTATSDGFMDNIHNLRDQHGADLVALFEDEPGGGGIAWLLNTASGSPDLGFSISRIQQASGSSYTHVHEMGHNMGCGHHADQNFQAGPGLFDDYSSGWRWTGTNSVRYCSLMSYEAGSFYPDGQTHSRVAHFSNPSINHQGVPTGDATDGDNARTIRETKHVIAAYRDSADDNYEPNNNWASAYDISNDEDTFLNTIDGYGIQADEDWYEIYVSSGFENVIVSCTFTDSEGDIDIELRNSFGGTFTPVSGSRISNSVTDDEYIDCVVPSSGTYYIRVHYDDEGNSYNLWWDDLWVSSGEVDLVAEYVEGQSSTATVGETVGVDTIYSNDGSASSGPFTCKIYLSPDNVLDGDEIEIHSFQSTGLPSGYQGNLVTRTSDPLPVTGEYYFIFEVDVYDDVTESLEGNNWVASVSKIIISAGGIGPDAYEDDDVYTSYNSISSGSTQIHSIHDGGTDVDWVRFILSDISDVTIETSGPSGDTVIWLYTSSGVPNTSLDYDDDGGSDWFSRISRTSMAAGTYYVKIEEYGNNNEIPSYNIDLTVSQSGYIDLIADSVSGPSSCSVGETIPISYSISNIGTLSSGAFDYAFYLSTNTNIDPASDTKIFEGSIANIGGPGTDSNNIDVTINVAGTYYLGLIADCNDDISDTNDGNNIISSIQMITIHEPIIAVNPLSIDFGILSEGATETSTLTIENNGPGSLHWTITESISWLSVNITSGTVITGTQTILVSINTAGLADGPYNEILDVESNGGDTEVIIYLIIDSTQPTTYITSPLDNSVMNIENINVQWETTQSLSNIDYFEIKLNANAWINAGKVTSYQFLDLDEGSHTISVKAYGLSGISFTDSVNFKVDMTTSTTSPSIIGTPGQNSWYTSAVNISLIAVDDFSGVNYTKYKIDNEDWQIYANAFTINDDGIHTISYYSVDNGGTIESMNETTIKIDATSPDTADSITGTKGTGDWYVSNIGLILTGIDPISSIESTYYRFNDGTRGPWILYSSSIKLNNSGIYDIDYYSVDQAGNTEFEESLRINLDKESPQADLNLSKTPNANNWHSEDVTVSLTGNDGSGSGISMIKYRIDYGIWQTYSTPLTLSTDGTQNLDYYSIDNAGNDGTVNSHLVNIDKILPESNIINPINNQIITQKNIIISWNGDDEHSGIEHYEISVNGEDWQNIGLNTSYDMTTENGNYTVSIRGYDNAGNFIEITKTFTVQLPFLSIIASSNWLLIILIICSGLFIAFLIVYRQKNDESANLYIRSCPNCSSIVAGNFCGDCGISLTALALPTPPKICTNCGAIAGGEFCGDCGSSVESSESVLAIRTCPRCGDIVGGNFCGECGHVMKDVETNLLIKQCPNCEGLVSGKFCGDCGIRIEDAQAQDLSICANCGSEVGASFCGDCGTSIDASPVILNNCSKCGNEVGGPFCGNCGAPRDNDLVSSLKNTCPKCGSEVGGPFCGDCGFMKNNDNEIKPGNSDERRGGSL